MKNKPTVTDVLPIVYDYYALPGNYSGGNLKAIFESGKVKNKDVIVSLKLATNNNDKQGIKLARLLLRMSKTQRFKLHFNKPIYNFNNSQ